MVYFLASTLTMSHSSKKSVIWGCERGREPRSHPQITTTFFEMWHCQAIQIEGCMLHLPLERIRYGLFQPVTWVKRKKKCISQKNGKQYCHSERSEESLRRSIHLNRAGMNSRKVSGILRRFAPQNDKARCTPSFWPLQLLRFFRSLYP